MNVLKYGGQSLKEGQMKNTTRAVIEQRFSTEGVSVIVWNCISGKVGHIELQTLSFIG